MVPPREDIQASPETVTKKSAKSTKSFSAACHLRGGLPHVCGFGGAVADTLCLLKGQMSPRLDGALFLTLENYSLMYFKGILMRTLEAQKPSFADSVFKAMTFGAPSYLSPPSSCSFLPMPGGDCLKGPYRPLLPFCLFAFDGLISPRVSSKAPS